MAPTPSLRSVKTLNFRGGSREFSNRYHFTGGSPASLAAWQTLADAVTDLEQAAFPDYVEIVKTVYYDAGSELPIGEDSWTKVGPGGFSNWQAVPGETAALVRYSTTARTSKNHPIYLFNYYHGIGRNTLASPEDANAVQLARLADLADAWLAGISDGTTSHVRAGPNGATAVSRQITNFLTHRDFPL
jgi:hypothetical protein